MTAPDPQEVFKQAAYFDYAARLLAKHTNARTEAIGLAGGDANCRVVARDGTAFVLEIGPNHDFHFPCMKPLIVNSVLSSELYLKCILCLETGDFGRVHELVALYNAVSAPRQTRIKDLFEAESNRRPDAALTRQRTNDKSELELGGVLRQLNKAFVTWRYSFEGLTESSTIGHGPLRDALRRTVLEIKPDWKQLLDALSTPPTFLTH